MIFRVFIAVLYGLTLSLVIATGIIAVAFYTTDGRAKENLVFASSAPLNIPTLPPSIDQRSINMAIKMYKIRVPGHVIGPVLDSKLSDRGMTMRKGALSKLRVSIGPDAFTSWSLLGSTIAHEVEVHCKQNFFAIHLMDLFGFEGTSLAEREAYSFELASAKRFGLAPYDQDLIRSTMNYYYPDTTRRSKVLQFSLNSLRDR